jgi:uncharacterized membrane protein
MKAEAIFIMTMAMIDEMTDTGQLDETTTAEYKAKAPSILTMLQNEIIGIENRYRKQSEMVYPVPIKTLEQSVQIDDIKANTLLTNGLAANLMLHEDKTLANYFEQRYEEMKGMFLKPSPRRPEKREDVYDATLKY